MAFLKEEKLNLWNSEFFRGYVEDFLKILYYLKKNKSVFNLVPEREIKKKGLKDAKCGLLL